MLHFRLKVCFGFFCVTTFLIPILWVKLAVALVCVNMYIYIALAEFEQPAAIEAIPEEA